MKSVMRHIGLRRNDQLRHNVMQFGRDYFDRTRNQILFEYFEALVLYGS